MSTEKIINDINSHIAGLIDAEDWNKQSEYKRNAIINRAICDINAYANALKITPDMSDEIIINALKEQALHLAKQAFCEKNGKIIESETVTNFGSRQYKYTNLGMLSERAKFYIDSYVEKPQKIRILR